MDNSFITHNDEDFELKDYLLDARLGKCPPAIMEENWSSSADDILDSMFSMDLLNHSNDQQLGLGSFADFCDSIKMETGDYEITVPSLPDTLLSDENNVISSNSSDSGLSSDNLEAEMSPPYEPLSPPSLGPSNSERGEKRLSVDVTHSEPIQSVAKKICNNDRKPKVIVQKVPQVMTLTNVAQQRNSPVQTPKLQQQVFIQHQQQSIQRPQIVNSVRGNEIKFVKLSPQSFTASNNKPVTIQVKNSSSGAKIQAKPGTLFLNKPKLTEMKKLVRVQNSNPRSILIPVTLQDVKELKTFKIVNTTAVRTTPLKANEPVELTNQQTVKHIAKPKVYHTVDIKQEASEDSFIENSSDSESIIIEDGYENDDYSIHDPEAPYPKLVLTTEEKRLLSKEGINLPAHYPLTKHEERELKRIRRKIRNKISAQDSRKRKKEYVDGLEERVKQCTEENQSLMKRIKQLQNQNQNLMSQMKRLQSLLTKGTNKTTQPTTCLMVLLLSLALVAAPNLKLGQNAKEGDLEEAVQETILQNRRNLLFNNKEQNVDIFDEEVNMSDIVSAIEFNNERECNVISKTNSNSYTSPALGETKCKKMKLSQVDFIDEIDDENWYMLQKDHNKANTGITMEKQQENRKQVQTSGFNIENPYNTPQPKEATSWLNEDILDMVTPTVNGLYDLSMDKMVDATVLDVAPKDMYVNQLNVKQNSSEMRQIKKY